MAGTSTSTTSGRRCCTSQGAGVEGRLYADSQVAMTEAAGMSYLRSSRAFKQSTGVSPNNYLVGRRVERAKRLVAEADAPVVEAALRVGLASRGHFTTTIRRLVGTTPKAYRLSL